MPRTVPMKALQRADQWLGRLVLGALQPLRWLAPRTVTGEPGQVLLVKFWGIGSLQLLTPAVATLRLRHPGARLTLLTLAENEAFARGLGLFDEVRTVDVACAWPRLVGRLLRLFRRVRAARYDALYDFEFFTRFSAVLCLVSGAPRRHGFHSPTVWRGGAHTDTVPFNRYWHVARNFRALAGGEDGEEVHWRDLTPFQVSAAARASVQVLLQELPADRPVAVLNPNAGSLSLERRWPAGRFADLAGRLIVGQKASVVLVGSAGERDHVARVAREARELLPLDDRGSLLDLAGRLDIGGLCALLAEARLVVSNDSGPMHLAAALGTPTLGLFGPETPLMYRPLGARARYLWDPPVCSPCINVHDNKRSTCIHGQPECLMNLDVERVLAEAQPWLRAGHQLRLELPAS